MKITCVAGLPGSGKSHLLYRMSDQYAPLKSWVVDDITELGQLPGVHIVHNISHLMISDPHFCISSTRQLAEKLLMDWYQITPQWIFFENDPPQCLLNVRMRNDGRQVHSLIHALSKVYEIPSHAEQVTPVYKSS